MHLDSQTEIESRQRVADLIDRAVVEGTLDEGDVFEVKVASLHVFVY
jgi:hypothetical protein